MICRNQVGIPYLHVCILIIASVFNTDTQRRKFNKSLAAWLRRELARKFSNSYDNYRMFYDCVYVLLLLVTTGSPHCTLSIVYNLNSLWAPLSTDESPERTTQAGWWRDGTHCIITHLKLKSEIEMSLISCCIPRTKIPIYRKVVSFVILASIFLVI